MTTTNTEVWDALAALVNEDGAPMFPTFRVECGHAPYKVSGACSTITGVVKCDGWMTDPRLLHDTDHVGLVIAAVKARAGAVIYEEYLPHTIPPEVYDGMWHVRYKLSVSTHPGIRHALLLAVIAQEGHPNGN